MKKGSRKTFNLVSLGCPKNTVDSERLMGAFATAGWTYAETPGDAALCLVNTCGFLRSSCEEAAKTFASLRKASPGAKIVALGCLAERVGGEPGLADYLTGADASFGFADYARLPELCGALLEGAGKRAETVVEAPRRAGYRGAILPKSYMRWLSGPAWRYEGGTTAWLKLGEGCSNHCAYCAIPLIRGERVSRPLEEIVANAQALLADGARELNLVAQDTTAYGMDRDGRSHLAELLRALLKLPDAFFLRVLYAHPRHLGRDVLELMASDPRICPYLDLPIQHSESRVLKVMRRGYDGRRVRELLDDIHEILPGAALRTTLIVGHPGETEAEFERLLAFVEEGHFAHLGAFAWSPEPGTAALRSRAPVAPPEEAQRRRKAVMAAQKKVSAAHWRTHRGEETAIFPDTPRGDGTWSCHSLYQAPDGLDGTCVLEVPPELAYRFDSSSPVVATITMTAAYSIRATLSPL